MNLIAAIDENGAIGNKGKLLFESKQDMDFFKKKTLGKIVIMGRVTYESIGTALKGRTNIVLSRNEIKDKDVITCSDYASLFDYIKQYNSDDVFVIGGEKVYEKLMPFCTKLYITKFAKKVSADRFLKIDLDEFYLTEASNVHYENGIAFNFLTYETKNVCVKKNCSLKLIATCNKCKQDKSYGLIPEPSIKFDTLYRNKKNNQAYIVLDISENQTNCRKGETMVIYQNINGGKIYPRNVYEFGEKFEEIKGE